MTCSQFSIDQMYRRLLRQKEMNVPSLSRLVPPLITVLPLAILCNGCHPSANRGWDTRVHQWGTMYEVMAEGKSQARVRLADVVKEPHAYGVGALDQLSGEITIVDSDVWIGEADGDECATTLSSGGRTSASLLAVSYVPEWREVKVEKEMTMPEVEAFVGNSAGPDGLPEGKAFPFMIDGQLDAKAHVINGSCPNAPGGVRAGAEPCRYSEQGRSGRIVGFFAENAAGILTHHDHLTHMHVVFDSEPQFAGHVDELTVHPGATLFLPAVARN